MDISAITDKKELAYMLIKEQDKAQAAQQNCQLLKQRIFEIEQSEDKQPGEEPQE